MVAGARDQSELASPVTGLVSVRDSDVDEQVDRRRVEASGGIGPDDVHAEERN